MMPPFFWMLSAAVKRREDIFVLPSVWIPQDIVWRNFADVWAKTPMAQAYITSLKIAGLVAVATVIASSLTAYAIAKIEFPGKRLSFATLMATIMIPSQATLFPVYILMRRIGRIDTYWPLIAPPALTNALGVFRLRQLCTGVPNDLIDASRIEGDFRDVANLNRDQKSLGYKAQTYLFPYVYVATELYNPGAAATSL